MAITAVDSERGHVVLMAEWDRLRTRYACISHVRRTLKVDTKPERESETKNPRIDREPGKYVSAAMEDLHRSGFFLYSGVAVRPEHYWKTCSLFFETENYSSL
jgi:hypothetical protein